MSKVQLQPVVKAALELFPHSLHHQIELTATEAIEYCKEMDLSDESYGIPMLEVVEEINKIVPQSRGNYVHQKFNVGRAGSPLLVLSIAKLYVSEFDWDSLIPQLNAIAILGECDEYEVIENTDTSLEYRFWWD